MIFYYSHGEADGMRAKNNKMIRRRRTDATLMKLNTQAVHLDHPAFNQN